MNDSAAAPSIEAAADEEFVRSIPNQAWARWAARSIDSLLLAPLTYGVMFSIGFYLTLAVEAGAAAPDSLDWTTNLVISTAVSFAAHIVLMTLIEPIFLSTAGATPGKWIMGVRVRDARDRKLGYFKAMVRTAFVMTVGMGLLIPIISAITIVGNYLAFQSKGETIWDDAMGTVVHHAKRHEAVWFTAITAVITLRVASIILNRMSMSE